MLDEKENFKEGLIKKLKDNDFSIYFYAPNLNTPSGGCFTLMKQAVILKEAGHNVKLIFEPKIDERASYQASQKAQKRVYIYEKYDPKWMTDLNYSSIEFVPQAGQDDKGQPITKLQYTDGTSQDAVQITLNPEDFLIIPEGFGNVMAQLKGATCKKIILAQSWIYILNSLQPGQSWGDFGLEDCISVSDAITQYIKSIFPATKVKQYSQSISRELFNKPEKLSDKKPVIGFSCTRGPETRMKMINVIKNFQSWYPHYKWIRFVELSNLSREEYASRLKECSIVLSMDEIGGFCTQMLETMAVGSTNVSYSPYGAMEYINTENGFWVNNGDVFQMSELLGIAVDKLLNGELDVPEIQESYEKTLDRYTEEKERESILNIYKEYLNERIDEISKL